MPHLATAPVPSISGGGRPSLLPSSSVSLAVPVGYPEAFYAHTHKTPERSNRQKKLPTPATDPITPDDIYNKSCRRPVSRVVGRLQPKQLHLFHNNTINTYSHNNTETVSKHHNDTVHSTDSTNSRNNGEGNVGNGFSHIQQQMLRQQKPQSPPAAHASIQPQRDSGNLSVASSASSAAHASQATLAATIPSSHVNIITQAYGNSADLYRDILQIPPEMTSEREIRIAYFRRGRQVLAEKLDVSAINKVGNVSQIAKVKFQAVSMAYEILSNPVWKESYDLHGLYGPDSLQEPEGTSVMLAEDASLVDPTPDCRHNLTLNDSHGSKPSPVPLLYDLRQNGTSNADPGLDASLSSTYGADGRPPSLCQSQSPSSETSYHANSDNVSCVSQSTGGTTSGVLRKSGSFLGKLNSKQKAQLDFRAAGADGRRNSATRVNCFSGNNSPYNQDHHRAPKQSATVRWNEEVEELIFRQDPDEISFKAGTTAAPVVAEEAPLPPVPYSPSSQHLSRPYPQPTQAQAHQLEQSHPQHINDSNEDPNYKGGTAKDPNLVQHAGAPDREDSYPGSPRALSNVLKSSRTNSKRKVVLDTTELGTHLEKLDKVADSIANIFDELEASFDGLLGGFGAPKPCATAAAMMKDGNPMILPAPPAMTSVPIVPPLLPPPSHCQQLSIPQQQSSQLHSSPSQGAWNGTDETHLGAPGAAVRDSRTWSQQAYSTSEPQYEESSYHTPPISAGDCHRAGELTVQEDTQVSVPPGTTQEQQEEALRVEEQAMALLREVAAFQTTESAPPSDVLVKTKRNHHQRVESAFSDASLIAGQEETKARNVPSKQNQDLGEAASLCASDLAAGGENTTVATSVVSLLDPTQHTNAPLKPAASTEITGAKTSRKRLKHVQRRRKEQQQQRAVPVDHKNFILQHQQKEKEDFYDFIDPLGVLNTPLAAKNSDYTTPSSVKDRTNHWNLMAKASLVASYKDKKTGKKKQTEDLYFESLYQNFFALPKERMPNEMTVRTRPNRGSCSVSTLSHSVTTVQEPTRLDAWNLANRAFSNMPMGDKATERDRRARHHKNAMARVDEMLVHRSEASGLDMTFDSSFPDESGLDTTCDSGTVFDTTFDSTAADTAFSSAVNFPHKSEGDTAAATSDCNPTPGVAFLQTVFDVPLEAPLEYWCGEAKDCASSAKPTHRHKRMVNGKVLLKRRKAAIPEKDETSSVDSTSLRDSAILAEEGHPTDESITLLDPPTHDSRIEAHRCDDSTLNTLNTNNAEEDSVSQYGAKPESKSCSPSSSDQEFEATKASPIAECGAKKEGREGPAMERFQLVGVAKDLSVESPNRIFAGDPSMDCPTVNVTNDRIVDGSLQSIKDIRVATLSKDVVVGRESPLKNVVVGKDLSRENYLKDVVVIGKDRSREIPFKDVGLGKDPSIESHFKNVVVAKDPIEESPSKNDVVTGDPFRKGALRSDVVTDAPRRKIPFKQVSTAKSPSRRSPLKDIVVAKSRSTGSCGRIIDAETASESQFVQISVSDTASEYEAIETASISTPACPEIAILQPSSIPELAEKKEGISVGPLPMKVKYNSQLEIKNEMLLSPSSLSGRRVGFPDCTSKHKLHVEVQDEAMTSSATSVSSAVSNEKAKSSGLLASMLNFLQKATDENPSLACVKANVSYGLESWRASNDACMDAIVIPEDDMTAVLDILQNEIKRARPGFMAKSE